MISIIYKNLFPTFFICFSALFLFTGCESSSKVPQKADEERAAILSPADAALNEKYQRSCALCHTKIAAKAPLAGFYPAWRAPLDKGIDELVKNVSAGFGAMPAGGLCIDCSDEDFKELIIFMSSKSSS